MYISSESTTRSWGCHGIWKSVTTSAIFCIFQRLRRWALAFPSCADGRRGRFLSLWGWRPARTSGSGRPFNHNWNYSFFITAGRRPLPWSWRKRVRTHRWGRVGRPTVTPIGILRQKYLKNRGNTRSDTGYFFLIQPVFSMNWSYLLKGFGQKLASFRL